MVIGGNKNIVYYHALFTYNQSITANVVFWYINLCSEIQPVLNNFAPIGFIPEMYFFARSNGNDEIFDARILLMGFVRLLIGFVAPMQRFFCHMYFTVRHAIR